MCQDIVNSLDEGVGIDAIITDFSKAFDLVPHDQLLMKLTASGMDSRVLVWVREFLVGRMGSRGVGRAVLGSQCCQEMTLLALCGALAILQGWQMRRIASLHPRPSVHEEPYPREVTLLRRTQRI
jgi:hypothetical protein